MMVTSLSCAGYLGIPPFGFPEQLRSLVVAGKKLPNGKECFEARPGAEMKPLNFEKIEEDLKEKFEVGSNSHTRINEHDVVSYTQYPKVFEEFMQARQKYGDLSVLDTRTFVEGMTVGQVLHCAKFTTSDTSFSNGPFGRPGNQYRT
jgi:pyruvate carboxylase